MNTITYRDNEEIKSPNYFQWWSLACEIGDIESLRDIWPHVKNLDPDIQAHFHNFGFKQACQYGQTGVIDFYLSGPTGYEKQLKNNPTLVFDAMEMALYGGRPQIVEYLAKSNVLNFVPHFQNPIYQEQHVGLYWWGFSPQSPEPEYLGEEVLNMLKNYGCPTNFLESTNYKPFIDAWDNDQDPSLVVFVNHYGLTGQEPTLQEFMASSLTKKPHIEELMGIWKNKKELEKNLALNAPTSKELTPKAYKI